MSDQALTDRILASTSTSVIYRSQVRGADLHKNRVPCIIVGSDAPIRVETSHGIVAGSAVYIAPDKPHRVCFGNQTSHTLYLENVRSVVLQDAQTARPIAQDMLNFLYANLVNWTEDRETEFLDRFRFARSNTPSSSDIAKCINRFQANPLFRLSQDQLSRELGVERTKALKLFKASTGMTLRSFQIWKSLRGALEDIAQGEDFQTAGLDHGFCDAAHFSRTFRTTFGMSLSQALQA